MRRDKHFFQFSKVRHISLLYFLLIIISFKLVILLRFLEHSELNKFVIIAGFQEGLAPITSLTVCHIIEDQLLFIFIFRELQQPVIHAIELAFEPPLLLY